MCHRPTLPAIYACRCATRCRAHIALVEGGAARRRSRVTLHYTTTSRRNARDAAGEISREPPKNLLACMRDYKFGKYT
eukprot:6185655-Pleurochrysis_carterae.AAC.4